MFLFLYLLFKYSLVAICLCGFAVSTVAFLLDVSKPVSFLFVRWDFRKFSGTFLIIIYIIYL